MLSYEKNTHSYASRNIRRHTCHFSRKAVFLLSIWAALAAFLTGICASLGVGGGMILTVYLTVFADFSQLDSQGINLVFFLPVALLAVILHSRNKLISWRAAITALLTGAAGAVIGTLLAHYIKGETLRLLFAGFLLIIGIREIICAVKNKDT